MMSGNNQTVRIANEQIPNKDTAVHLYEIHGGQLTLFSEFGTDSLMGNPVLCQQREEFLFQNIPSYEAVFNEVVNGNSSMFQRGLLCFILFPNIQQ